MFENRLSSLRGFFFLLPYTGTGFINGLASRDRDEWGGPRRRERGERGGGGGGRPPSYSHVSTRVLILIFIKKCSYSIKRCSYFV